MIPLSAPAPSHPPGGRRASRRGRPRRARPRLALLALAALLFGGAAAQTIGEGTELLLTTPDSQRIVGHGLVGDGRLTLNLSADAGDFVALLLHPDGSIEIFPGAREGRDLRLIVGDEAVPLERILADQGIDLDLNGVGGAFRDPVPRDDERLAPPGPDAPDDGSE